MKRIVIIGATSAVAKEIAKIHAAERYSLCLVGRNQQSLDEISTDLEVRGAKECSVILADLTDQKEHKRIWDSAYEAGRPDIVYIAHGSLPDQEKCQQDYSVAYEAMDVNVLSVMSLLTDLANRMEKDQHGQIAVISSVAGDRGRQSNYVYGTAKAALTTFLQGLRNRMHKAGVHVLTAKPGFIDTPMTAHIEKGGPLWATPEKVASDIVKGVHKRKDVIYTPVIWFFIMTIVKSIPEKIFKRLSM